MSTWALLRTLCRFGHGLPWWMLRGGTFTMNSLIPKSIRSESVCNLWPLAAWHAPVKCHFLCPSTKKNSYHSIVMFQYMKTLQHTNKRPVLTNLHDQFLHVHKNITLQYSGQWFCLLSHYYFCTAGLAYDNSIIRAIIVSHERPLTFSSFPPPPISNYASFVKATGLPRLVRSVFRYYISIMSKQRCYQRSPTILLP